MVTHLRVGQRGENLGDQIVGLDVLRLCLVGEAEPMSQHIRGQSLDVGWNDVARPCMKAQARDARVNAMVARGDAPNSK